MSELRCELCGRFMPYDMDTPAYVEGKSGNDRYQPPELVPAHWECVAKEDAKVRKWHRTRAIWR